MRALLWLYALAIRVALPHDASRRDGTDMLATFAALVRDARTRGRLAALSHAAAEFRDLFAGAARSSPESPAPTPRRRDPSGDTMIVSLAHDLRLAVRALGRSPAFTVVAVLTLGLGLSANAAVFTVAWNLLLKPLPWPDAHELVQIWNTSRPSNAKNIVAPANYLDFERESTQLEAIAAYTYMNYSQNLTGAGEPVELRLRAVTGQYFLVFGVGPLAGRTLGRDDEREHRRVIVIGEGLWRRQFGGDASVIGRQIRLDDAPYEVVGVMPASFDVAARPMDGWIPYVFTPETRERRLGYFLGVVGRLKPGVTVARARDELTAIAARASERHPSSNARIGATANAMIDELAGSTRAGVLLLSGGAALVLLVACGNLTSLLLARATGRRRELAVRAAIGATRSRLMRYLVAESVVVSVAAGAVGLGAGLWAVRAIAVSAPPTVARASTLALDLPVVAGTFGLSVLGAVLFAMLPAWRATRPAGVDALRGRGQADRGAGRLRTWLVTSEVALATLLLAGASVLVASMMNVLRIDPGFDPSGVVAGDLRLPFSRYDTVERRSLFFEQVFERLRGVRGITDTCATNDVPLENEARMTYVPESTETLVGALPLTVSPGCFPALRIRLVRGRLFEAREPEPVAIVSEDFARRAFPDRDALGRVIRIGIPTGEPLTIVGIVADSRRVSLEAAPYGQVYEPASQSKYFMPTRVLVRSSAAPEIVAPTLRQAVRDVDPAQPLANVRTLEDVVARSMAARRFNMTLIGSFALMAVVLAGIGLYGLLAHSVAERQAEIGVRMALGASSLAVVWLVCRAALCAVAIGVPVGLAGSWAVSRVLTRFVFGVSPTDPAILLGTVLAITAIAALAAYLPARRATRLDPVSTLRAD